MGEFPDTDRRSFQSCPRHEDVLHNFELGERRMERYERKIDDLLEGQAKQALAIQSLQGIIGNGLTGDMKRTREGVEELTIRMKDICVTYDARIAENDRQLAEFKWFRDWANKFKDGMIRKILTLAFYGGTVIGILYLYEKYTKTLLK